MTTEQEIKEYAIRLYGSEEAMPAANKKAMRQLIEKEDRFWEREAVREDSHSPVGDLFNAREVFEEQH